MRYGIISDIHANFEAFLAVLDHLEGVDQVICLGDVVGYGPNPNECCELVQSLGCVTLLGNHDAAALGDFDLDWFNPHARAAVEWTQEALTPESRRFLRSLPNTYVCDDLTAAHGSLPAPFEYISSPWEVRSTFDAMTTRVCFIGHTHIAEYYILREGCIMPEQIALPQGGKISIREHHRYVINCGSVGQPRDGNPRASFGIYDTQTPKVDIIRVNYPLTETQKKMQAIGLPHILWERLAYGR